MITPSNVNNYIFTIRGTKIMLDFHLAYLYNVETRALKQQVKRNSKRFPEDFMFQLSKSEWSELITNCDKLGKGIYTPYPPLAFTEQGISMLAAILRSDKAIEINIEIMRTFVQMRKVLISTNELEMRLDYLESKYDNQFKIIFKSLKELIKTDKTPRTKIGFKSKNDSSK